MNLALLCAGQGRQQPGMFDIFEREKAAEPIFDATAALLGQDPRQFVAEASKEALYANRASQLLCVTSALAAAACLAPPRMIVAGYSVGEMAAWGAAGIWDAETTLHLTARRAELMDQADSGGGLGFVRGLDRQSVEALAAEFRCAIAIINPDRLFIIGGGRTDIVACCSEALSRGATNARPIDVHVASHTPRLASAVAPFEQTLRTIAAARPSSGHNLLSAFSGSLTGAPATGLSGLAAQLATPIDWAATLDALMERGVDRVLEIGPGDALSAMVRSAYPSIAARTLDDFRSIEGARAWISATGH
jgi:[acyl-carrier-protein] S-malonyltransferase